MFNILYAEDDSDIASLIMEVLSSLPVNIVHVPDGADAWYELLHREKLGADKNYDLLLTDNQMSTLNGEVLVEMVRNRIGSDIPILVHTSTSGFPSGYVNRVISKCDYGVLYDEIKYYVESCS